MLPEVSEAIPLVQRKQPAYRQANASMINFYLPSELASLFAMQPAMRLALVVQEDGGMRFYHTGSKLEELSREAASTIMGAYFMYKNMIINEHYDDALTLAQKHFPHLYQRTQAAWQKQQEAEKTVKTSLFDTLSLDEQQKLFDTHSDLGLQVLESVHERTPHYFIDIAGNGNYREISKKKAEATFLAYKEFAIKVSMGNVQALEEAVLLAQMYLPERLATFVTRLLGRREAILSDDDWFYAMAGTYPKSSLFEPVDDFSDLNDHAEPASGLVQRIAATFSR